MNGCAIDFMGPTGWSFNFDRELESTKSALPARSARARGARFGSGTKRLHTHREANSSSCPGNPVETEKRSRRFELCQGWSFSSRRINYFRNRNLLIRRPRPAWNRGRKGLTSVAHRQAKKLRACLRNLCATPRGAARHVVNIRAR